MRRLPREATRDCREGGGDGTLTLLQPLLLTPLTAPDPPCLAIMGEGRPDFPMPAAVLSSFFTPLNANRGGGLPLRRFHCHSLMMARSAGRLRSTRVGDCVYKIIRKRVDVISEMHSIHLRYLKSLNPLLLSLGACPHAFQPAKSTGSVYLPRARGCLVSCLVKTIKLVNQSTVALPRLAVLPSVSFVMAPLQLQDLLVDKGILIVGEELDGCKERMEKLCKKYVDKPGFSGSLHASWTAIYHYRDHIYVVLSFNGAIAPSLREVSFASVCLGIPWPSATGDYRRYRYYRNRCTGRIGAHLSPFLFV